MTWQRRTDHPATVLDVDEGTVYAAYTHLRYPRDRSPAIRMQGIDNPSQDLY
ncbi:hypothetical protein ABZ642_14960 [Streptomyces sp. NPDC007157]|uniref:hypothetical protein n=1 Tax=Streptomyces sp. NPDC007157 TaxID=3154681 RepID=UPI0033E50D08